MANHATEDYEKKRIRRHAPKSRGGCITCKKRRVKCDETKPVCLKCLNGAWKCDGYPSPAAPLVRKLIAILPRNSSVTDSTATWAVSISSQRNSLLDYPGSPKEHRSLDYFSSRTANDLGIFAEDTFWRILASKAASIDNSIRHGLIAVARYHEDHIRELESGGIIDHQMAQPFALTQYNKAIKAITSRLRYDKFSHQIALLACFLFFCLEFFKGSPETALAQLHSGIMMLATYNRLYGPGRQNKGQNKNMSRGALDEINDSIAIIFSRFRLSVINTTPILPRFYIPMGDFTPAEKISLTQPFNTIASAKIHLDTLISRTFQPCDVTSQGCVLGQITTQEIARRKAMIGNINTWTQNLDLLVMDNIPSPSLQETSTIRLLQIRSIMTLVFNSVTLIGKQTAFDGHLEHFQSLFSLTEQAIRDQLKYPEIEPLSLSARQVDNDEESHGTLQSSPTTPLAFICARCRHPILRRRAMQLLIWMSTQSASWSNALVYAKVSDIIISFEESHGNPTSPVTPDPLTWPTESQRVHGCFFLPVHNPKERTQTTIFLWQPNGEDTPIEHWFERVKMGERATWRVCFPEEEK